MELDLIIAIIGIIIGAIIGVISSFGLWKLEKNYQERNIAIGFHLEIKESQTRITEMAQILSNVSNNANNLMGDIIFTRPRILGVSSQPDMNSQISGHIFAPSEPFYPQYGIFLDNYKEISKFHPELANSLYAYYTNLFEAENDRIFLNTAKTSGDRFLNTPEILNAKYEDMKTRIIYCSNEIPNLKKKLEDRINKRIF